MALYSCVIELRNRVFGLPAGRKDVVEKINPGTYLFLFDTDVKLLYGIYMATSTGKLNIEPLAFGQKFPAQVNLYIVDDAHRKKPDHAVKITSSVMIGSFEGILLASMMFPVNGTKKQSSYFSMHM